jgi:ubiquitin-protein ligase
MDKVLTSVYERRIANECREAEQLEQCNTDVIRFGPPNNKGDGTVLGVTLWNTTGLVIGPNGLRLVTEHEAELRFPRFFPAVPIEAYLRRPIFHPNVDPLNGFVCLWDRFSTGDTVVTAAWHLQQILTWRMLNLWTDHVMQPDAAEWYDGARDGHRLPLEYRELELPEGLGGLEVFSATPSRSRRRIV